MADDEDQASKTEDPTDRKLKKLREDGSIPKSKEVNNLFMLAAMVLGIALTVPWQMRKLGDVFTASLSELSKDMGGTAYAIGSAMQEVGLYAIVAILPLFGILMLFAWLGGFVQSGPLWSIKAAQPKLSRISVLKGLKRLFSMNSLVELLKSVFKLVVLGGVMFVVAYTHRADFVALTDASVGYIVRFTYKVVLEMLLAALAVMVILGIADILYQRFKFTKENRMSRKELKDEMKDTEGDPHIKNRQRQIRMERAKARMMEAVPESDVVITNPTHYAVALRYKPNEGDTAPIVVAKGIDFMAQRIRELATEHNVPLYEDPPLARQLYAQADIDDEIPLELYEVTAKVISYVTQLKEKMRGLR